jgi:glycosyltransferase involved in cell wall biosynthesis
LKLPDLKQYRKQYKSTGLSLPLSVVALEKKGLLNQLPSCATGLTGWPWTEQTDPKAYSHRITWPKITIVMPSFNQAQFIEQSIRSVLLQNYPNLEFVVIDGGSTDHTPEILRKYDRWISYWQSEKDQGQSHAINLGFSLASGDYYAWLNSDDYYLKDVFVLVIDTFIKTSSKFVYGFGYNCDITTQKLELVKIMPFLDYFIKIPGLIQPSAFWNAEIHRPVWEDLHCSLDFELWLRLVKGHKRRLIRKPLSVAHVHKDAKTHDPKMQVKWHEDHLKIWSDEAHGRVDEWKRIVFFNRIRKKIYQLLGLI